MTDYGTGTQRDESGVMSGMFNDRESSEGAYRSLRDRGYSDAEINVMMSDQTRNKWYGYGTHNDTEMAHKVAEGAGIGGAAGGTLGALVGGIAALGTNLVLPGLGLVVWGPIAAAIAGAGAGGAAGTLAGALIGWGIPEDRAREYESGLKNGGSVIGVHPRSAEDADYLENDWRTKYRGQSIYR
jgi:hypothetical protein